VRIVYDVSPDHAAEFAAIKKVATRLGVGSKAVRRCRRQEEINAGLKLGVRSDEHAEIKRLKRKIAELWRANEILKAASPFFAGDVSMRPRARGRFHCHLSGSCLRL
jgi:transposase